MKYYLIILLLTFVQHATWAQKFGHFSSNYVVKQMPGYQQAQQNVDSLSKAWMEEVKHKYIRIGKMENQLAAEEVLLTPEMIRQKEAEIEAKIKEAIEYQYQVFGPEGLFFLKKKEIIQPELDKIYEAVEKVCRKHKLDYLLDKSSELIMVYSNPVHDYTDYVLEELGLGDPADLVQP
ncbi:MAG: OmpH family outer membrane protein [Candidatus Cyclobacteriaceae bacterium M3_2C_046]